MAFKINKDFIDDCRVDRSIMGKHNYWTEFEILPDEYEIYEYDYAITQNLYSFPLIIKSIFYNYPTLVFFITLFNTFQKLETSNENGEIKYSSYSQSLTTYILRLCAKHGLIKILSTETDIRWDLLDYYDEIGNANREKKCHMYNTIFIKKRSFSKLDIEFLYSILKFLKIPNDFVIFECSGDKIYARVNPILVLKNIFSIQIIKNIFNKNAYYHKIIKDLFGNTVLDFEDKLTRKREND